MNQRPIIGVPGRVTAWIGPALCLASVACSDETAGTGSLSVLLEAEDVIVRGLQAGERNQDIRDGWSVHFEKYLIAIGGIHVHHSRESIDAQAAHVFVADLTRIPESGLELWRFDGLRAGRWEFGYITPGASDADSRHSSVTAADYREMRERDWTYWIQGHLTRTDGRSCPPSARAEPASGALPNGSNSAGDACYAATTIQFDLGVRARTHYGLCELDGLPGVSIPVGGSQTVSTTIHGDHLFFNGFPAGGEGGVRRLAQWLADSDLNLDGTVTTEELAALAPAELAEIDERFQMAGSPLTPLDTLRTYVRAQLKTQGHFQGEGECAIDGVAHDHDHDEDDHDHDHDHDGGDHDHDHDGGDDHDHDHDHDEDDHDRPSLSDAQAPPNDADFPSNGDSASRAGTARDAAPGDPPSAHADAGDGG